MDKLQFPPSHQGIKIPVKRLGFQTADEPLYFCRGLLFLDGEQSTGN